MSTVEQLLQGLEQSIAQHCNASSYDEVLHKLQHAGHGSSICTAVWSAGAFAYRCKTCQTSPSSAVCVPCFKAGNHEGHDYILYSSPAGGCCDCGDPESWAPEGCCSQHKPGTQSPQPEVLVEQLGVLGAATVVAAACSALFKAGELVQDLATSAVDDTAQASAECSKVCQWLCKLVNNPVIRTKVCKLSLAGLGDVPGLLQQECFTWAGQVVADVAGIGVNCQTLATKVLQGVVPLKDIKPGRTLCWAYYVFEMMALLPGPALHDVTTLLLLLLYDPLFKEQAAVHALDCYQSLLLSLVYSNNPLAEADDDEAIVRSRSPTALGTALDRLTVQLLNNEDVVTMVTSRENCFQVLFSTLTKIINVALRVMSRPMTSRNKDAQTASLSLLHGGVRRVFSDISNVCHYPSIALKLITDTGLLRDCLLHNLSLLQGIAGQVCIQPGHPARPFASAVVPAAGNLELMAAFQYTDLVALCLGLKQQPGPELTPLAVEALGSATLECLSYLIEWNAKQDINDMSTDMIYYALQRGLVEVSPHLPLQRITAAFIQGLLSVELHADASCTQAASQALSTVLQRLTTFSNRASYAQQPIHGHSITVLPLMLQAWLNQITQRIWVRNDDDCMQVEFFCLVWSEFTIDLDSLLIMCSMAAAPTEDTLTHILCILGAGPLLKAAGFTPGNTEEGEVTINGRLKQEAACEAALRFLLYLLRNRVVCGTNIKDRLRLILLHYLAIDDAGHANLVEAIPQDLQNKTKEIDEVLDELCIYKPPSLTSAGMYSLKKDAWRSFDPHFLYSAKSASKAVERAYLVGAYKPHWQLQPPALLLPHSLQPMSDILLLPGTCQLVSHVLQQAACSDGKNGTASQSLAVVTASPPSVHFSPSEELTLLCVNLLALQIHHIQTLMRGSEQGYVNSQPQVSSGQGVHKHTSLSMQQLQEAVVRVGNMLEGTSSHQPGVLSTLRSLAISHATGQARPAAGHATGSDIADCCQYLATRCEEFITEARQAGLLPPPPAPASTPMTMPMEVAHGTGRPHGQVPGLDTAQGPASLSSPAKDAKANAMRRQQAIMEAMKARQAQFMQQAASDSDSSSDEEMEYVTGDDAATPLLEDASTSTATELQCTTCKPAMGEWIHTGGECLVCRASESTSASGPLGQLGFMGVCSALRSALELPTEVGYHEPKPDVGEAGIARATESLTSRQSLQQEQQGHVSQVSATSVSSLRGTVEGTSTSIGQQQQGMLLGNGNMSQPGVAAIVDAVARRRIQQFGPLVSIVDWQPGVHVHSCGHHMHLSCFDKYREAPASLAAADAQLHGLPTSTLAQRNFLCPKCRRLVNCLLPAAQFEWKSASQIVTDANQAPMQLSIEQQLLQPAEEQGMTKKLSNAEHDLDMEEGRGGDHHDKLTRLSTGGTKCVSTKHDSSGVTGVTPDVDTQIATTGNSMTDMQFPTEAVQMQHVPGYIREFRTLLCFQQSTTVNQHEEFDIQERLSSEQQQQQQQALDASLSWSDVATRTCGNLEAPLVESVEEQAYFEVQQYTTLQGNSLMARVQSQRTPAAQPPTANDNVTEQVFEHATLINEDQPTQYAGQSPSQSTGSDGSRQEDAAYQDHVQAADAMAPCLSPPQARQTRLDATSTLQTLPQTCAIQTQPAWPVLTYAERAEDVKARFDTLALGPVVWSLLAHNIAHWEACRRPRSLSTVLYQSAVCPAHSTPVSQRQASLQGLHPSQSTPAICSVTTPATASACVSGSPDKAATTSFLTGSTPDSASNAVVQDDTLHAAMVQAADSGITGLASVEKAHATGLASLVHSCVALGSGHVEATAARQHLQDVLSWLYLPLLKNDDKVAGQGAGTNIPTSIPPAPVGMSVGLCSAYEQQIAIAQGVEHRQEHAAIKARLFSRQAVNMRQLITDPFLLVLELLSLSLSAHGIPAGDGSSSVGMKVTTKELLAAAMQTVLPIAAVQSYAWCAAHAAGMPEGTPTSVWQNSIIQALKDVSCQPGAQVEQCSRIQRMVAAHTLPLLVRVYLLHCSLGDELPSHALMAQYASLPSLHTLVAGDGVEATGKYASLANQLCKLLGIETIEETLASVIRNSGCSTIPTEVTPSMQSNTTLVDSSIGTVDVLSKILGHWAGHIAWAMTGSTEAAVIASSALSKHISPLPWMMTTPEGNSTQLQPMSAQTTLLRPRWLAPPPALITLPASFQDLFLQLTDKPCYLCGEKVPHPSICLLTGRLMCSWWKGCSRLVRAHGGGLMHAMEACGGTTMILSSKNTKVLAVRPHRAMICQSPYLDAHGEEDVDLKRGRPLFLNMKVYGQLANLLGSCAMEFDWHMLYRGAAF